MDYLYHAAPRIKSQSIDKIELTNPNIYWNNLSWNMDRYPANIPQPPETLVCVRIGSYNGILWLLFASCKATLL